MAAYDESGWSFHIDDRHREPRNCASEPEKGKKLNQMNHISTNHGEIMRIQTRPNFFRSCVVYTAGVEVNRVLPLSSFVELSQLSF